MRYCALNLDPCLILAHLVLIVQKCLYYTGDDVFWRRQTSESWMTEGGISLLATITTVLETQFQMLSDIERSLRNQHHRRARSLLEYLKLYTIDS